MVLLKKAMWLLFAMKAHKVVLVCQKCLHQLLRLLVAVSVKMLLLSQMVVSQELHVVLLLVTCHQKLQKVVISLLSKMVMKSILI